MKYSFIVPIYNVEKYLARCIDSILGQTVADFECILVDDGSPDNCPQICDEYAERDSRIKVIHKENGGLSSARNAGLDVAVGEYVFFVDSDDYITENYLSVIDARLSESDSDMLCFGLYTVDKEGNVKSKTACKEGNYLLSDEKSRFDFICNTFLTEKIRWEAWNRVFKRSVIAENSLRFYDNKEIYTEDIYFAIQYLLHSKKVTSSYDVLYYRLQKDSVSSSATIDTFIELNKKILSYANTIGYKYFEKKSHVLFYRVMSVGYKSISYGERLAQLPRLNNKKTYKCYARKIIFGKKKLNKLTGGDFSRQEQANYFIYLSYACNKYVGKASRVIIAVLRKLLRVAKRAVNFFKNIPDKLWRKNIYLLGTEDFDNMGDQLIAVTEIKFLKENYPEYKVTELEASRFFDNIGALAKKVKKSDLIFLTGGGNMGDLYPMPPAVRADVISRFPNNRICIFPQTIFFDDMENARVAKEKYRVAKRLTITSREKRSFEINKELFTNAKHILTPDIVFYNDLQTGDKREEVIRLCLRSDKERTMTDGELDKLKGCLKDFKIEKFDMSLPFFVSVPERDKYLALTLKNYTTARLIITDRLHGMIVSTVTGTPCIVLNSKSHKLRESFDWIKDFGYVKFADSVDDVPKLLDELLALTPENCRYSNEKFKEYYQQILENMK